MNERQRRFVEEYLVDGVASAAYRRAGYKATGNAAEVAAARLLRHVQVAEAIKAATEARSATAGITAQWVLDRLRAESEERGKGSSPSARVKALELIGKHLKMFTDKHEHTGAGGGPVVVQVTEQVVANGRGREQDGPPAPDPGGVQAE